MTVSIEPPSVKAVKDVTQPEAVAATRSGFTRRLLLVVILVVLIFISTYALAWYNAYQLGSRFFRDAETSFADGDYLNALVGFEEFDPQTNSYVNRGGYLNTLQIWSSRYSWPSPSQEEIARQRIQEIINERLTIEQAEEYIRANTGRRGAPFFGEIYVRLGELYEQDGDIPAAMEIYESIPELFPNRPDLVEMAQVNLEGLSE